MIFNKTLSLSILLVTILCLIPLVFTSTSYYDPNSNVQTGWTAGTGTDGYTEIDNGVRQPNTDSITADYIASSCVANTVSEFGFPDITESPEYITLWVYTETGSNANYAFSLQQSDTERCATTVTPGTAAGWQSCTWASPSGDYSAMTMELSICSKIGGGANTNCVVYESYLEISYITDTDKPSIEYITPLDGNISKTDDMLFQFKVSDNAYFLNVSLWTNLSGTFEMNATNLTELVNGSYVNISLNDIEDGSYVYALNISDSSGNWNFSKKNDNSTLNFTFLVDTKAPLISLVEPSDNNWSTTDDIAFQFKVNDTNGMVNATLWTNFSGTWSLNATNTSHGSTLENNSIENITLSDIEDGTYVWNIMVTDAAGNSANATTNHTLNIDTIAPTLSNLAYNDSVNKPNIGVNISFTITEANLDGILCEVNGSVNYTGTANGNSAYCEVVGMTEGNSTVSIYLNDSVNHFVNATLAWFIIDDTTPTFTIDNPVNVTYTNDTIWFNLTVDETNTDKVSVAIDGIENHSLTNSSGNWNYLNNTLDNGTHYGQFYVNDTAGNMNSTQYIYFTIDKTLPVIEFITPLDGNISAVDDMVFQFKVMDGVSPLLNVSFWTNLSGTFSLNTTNSSALVNGSYVNISLNDVEDGSYIYSINISDDLGHWNFSQKNDGSVSNFTFLVDTTKPNITLNLPANGTTALPQDLTFNFTVRDNLASSMVCSIYLDGVLNQTNSSTKNNTLTNFNINDLSEGIHYWNVTCNDTAENTNWSLTRNFTVNVTPILTSVSAAPETIKGSEWISISPSGVTDPNSDNLYYYCSSLATPTESNTNCSQQNQEYASSYSNMNCTFQTLQTDQEYTVYCRVYDGTYYSDVSSTTYTTDSTPPTTNVSNVSDDSTIPYYDSTDDDYTNITVNGESGMDCRWFLNTDTAYSATGGTGCTTTGTVAVCSPTPSQGTPDYYISCADSLGNGQNTTQNLDVTSITVDWTAPNTTDDWTSSVHVPSYTINLTEGDNIPQDPNTTYCKSTLGNCTPSLSIDNEGQVTFTTADRGTNYFKYNSTDYVGNWKITNRTVLINQLPVFTSASDNATTIKGGTAVNVSTNSSDSDSGQQITLYVCNSTSISTSGCGDGHYCNASGTNNLSCTFNSESDSTSHIWYAYIYDGLNETATASKSGSYTTDFTTPDITVVYPENITYTQSSVPGAVTISEAANLAWYCLDTCSSNVSMDNTSSISWSKTLPNVADGSHNIIFYTNDSQGNVGVNSTRYFTVYTSAGDTTAPTITIWSPNTTYHSYTSVLLNITSDEALSWAGYTNNSGPLVNLSNVSTITWNITPDFSEGQHNITFYANDSSTNKNQGNTSTTIYVDLNDPSVDGFSCTNPVNDSQDVTCNANISDSLELDYAIISYNATGSWQNSSQLSLTGTSHNLSYTIASGNTSPGNFTAKIYVYDLSARANATVSYTMNVTDNTYPGIYNITYVPNTTDDVDPGVQINVTAGILEDYDISTVVLMYKNSSAINWTIATMTNTSATSYNASFTPQNETWQFKINATDDAGNQNISETTTIVVQNDTNAVVSTIITDITSFTLTQAGENKTLGNITLNNTGDTSLNFKVTASSSSIGSRLDINNTNNQTENYTISSGESINVPIEVNTTSFPVGLYDYTITVISTAGTTTYSKRLNIQSAAGPYLVVSIDTYSSTLDKGDTGVSFSSSVKNSGTTDAGDLWIAWELPSEFSIATGSQNRSIGNLPIGATATNTITIDVSPSADDKNVTVNATSNCTEAIGAPDSKVVTIGTPTTITEEETVTVTTGGGGGGISTAGIVEAVLAGEEVLSSSEIFELVRGEIESFPVNVKNIFKRTKLYNVSIKIDGYLSKYMDVSPSMINKIEFDKTKQFNVTITSPEYMEYGTYELTIVIKGKIIGSGIKKDLVETREVTLIIHTVSEKQANLSIEYTLPYIKEMQDKSFPTTKILKLLEQAIKALEENDYETAKELSEEIKAIRDNSFEANNLIQEIKNKIKKRTSITGAFLGAPISFHETENLLNLAMAAFEREDYETALQRAKDAQLTLALESKEFGLLFFFLDYWWIILLLAILLTPGSIFGYQYYIRSSISQKIRNLEKGEATIRNLIKEAQEKHFKEKTMGTATFHRTISNYQKRLSKIRKLRTKLRHKRARLIESKKLIKDLEGERKEVLNLLKGLQKDYFITRIISKAEYDKQIRVYNERLAEIEDEHITLGTMFSRKKRAKPKKIKIRPKKKIRFNIKGFFGNLKMPKIFAAVKLPKIKLSKSEREIPIEEETLEEPEEFGNIDNYDGQITVEGFVPISEFKFRPKPKTYDYNGEVKWIPYKNLIARNLAIFAGKIKKVLKL